MSEELRERSTLCRLAPKSRQRSAWGARCAAPAQHAAHQLVSTVVAARVDRLNALLTRLMATKAPRLARSEGGAAAWPPKLPALTFLAH